MVQKLVIKNFGPIKDAIIDVTDFMVFTGAQSSGKSTIAKLIYFFNMVEPSIHHGLFPHSLKNASSVVGFKRLGGKIIEKKHTESI